MSLPRLPSRTYSRPATSARREIADEESVQTDSGFYFSSEDDERWAEEHPLINVFSCGWSEDGRLGYVVFEGKPMQLCPRPLASLQITPASIEANNGEQFVCKKASAGSRHSLFLMIESSVCRPSTPTPRPEGKEDEENDEHTVDRRHKRRRKILIAGLNQVGLCEERGCEEPAEMPWEDSFDRPVDVVAGRGTSFVVTRRGHVYSYGHGRFGVLGHGDTESYTLPRRVWALEQRIVLKVGVGSSHAIALTVDHALFSWGRNHKGQLGIGRESPEELTPTQVVFPSQAQRADLFDIACGQEHSIALLRMKTRVSEKETVVFGWGDESRSQLGSGDREYRSRPQENRYVTKLCRSNGLRMKNVICGAFHNLVLLDSGQVLSWGANDYGQLGLGHQFDAVHPAIVNGLDRVISVSAGARHSMAVCERKTMDLMVWGYNAYGELGLGDTDIRLNPTKVSAMKSSNVRQVACGDRHSLIVTSHRPLRNNDVPALKPYFQILENEGKNRELMRKLKWTLGKEGMDPNLLENPVGIHPNQAGSNGEEMKNDKFERGLRYCLDTKCDPFDWRRKAMETCFRCYLPGGKMLEKVCLSCARLCVPNNRLVPYTRHRQTGDTCSCRTAGHCRSLWTRVRHAFDQICDIDDQCIGPNQVRQLLKTLRAPFPVENSDVEDCLSILADGVEDTSTPRLRPVPFERWYRRFYDEHIQGDYFPVDD